MSSSAAQALGSGVCRQCGKPISVDPEAIEDIDALPPDMQGLKDTLIRLGLRLVHKECADRFERQAAEEREVEQIEARARLWDRLAGKTFSTTPQWIKTAAAKKRLRMKSVDRALEWKFGERGLLLFGSKSGTGKTSAAWAVLKREFDSHKFVVATTHVDFSVAATKFSVQAERMGAWESAMRRCDILFVDDLGKSRFVAMNGQGRAAEEVLFNLIDHRINDKRPTILTSNFDGAQLEQMMSDGRGEYLVRRLREFFDIVSFDAEKQPTRKESET